MLCSGSISDYSDTSSLRTKLAAAAGVDAARVAIRVAAGSVVITATIDIPPSADVDATSVQASLASTLGTAAAASNPIPYPNPNPNS